MLLLTYNHGYHALSRTTIDKAVEEQRGGRGLVDERRGKKWENKRVVVCSKIYCIWT
jgi:hypothetical protein